MRTSHAIAIFSGLIAGLLVALLLTGSAGGAGEEGAGGPDGPRSSLLVGIAAPEHFGARELSLSKPIPVVLVNLTGAPLRLWRDWCSWGHGNISFEAVDGAGARAVIRRTEGEWRKNYPDFWTLGPAEPLVVQVKLDDGTWDIPAFLRNGAEEQVVKMRVIYEVEADGDARHHGVWAGKAASEERKYTLRR